MDQFRESHFPSTGLRFSFYDMKDYLFFLSSPRFSEAHVTPPLLLRKTSLALVFPELKEIHRGLLLLWKKAKSTNSIQRPFCHKAEEAAPTSALSGATKPFPRELQSASQRQAARALKGTCERLRFIQIYCAHLLAKGILRYQKVLREVIFCVRECWHIFPCKLIVMASSHHTI